MKLTLRDQKERCGRGPRGCHSTLEEYQMVSKSSEHQVVTSSRVCSGSEARGVERSRRGAEQDQRRRGELILNHKEASRAGRHSTQ